MSTYNVTLVRAYKVQVRARNRYLAKRLVEFFIGHPSDDSGVQDRKQYGFKIGELEMMENDAIYVEETTGL